MQDKTMIIMEPTEYGSDERACLYLERSVLGIVSLLNIFNMAKNREYKLLLLDDDGGIITETISENYKLFKLPKNFSLNNDMYAELYDGERLVLAGKHQSEANIDYSREYGKTLVENSINNDKNWMDSLPFQQDAKPLSAKEWADETGQTELFNSATEILNKFRDGLFNLHLDDVDIENNYESITKDDNCSNDCFSDKLSFEQGETEHKAPVECANESTPQKNTSFTFWQSISEDFDELFMSGKREQLLEGLFKNSMWTRHISENGGMCFGKIYKESNHFYGATPDIVALAVPVISKEANENVLGNFANFVRASEYDDFGFMVLLQESESGRAIKIIKNKG